jgi:hypothetical protein
MFLLSTVQHSLMLSGKKENSKENSKGNSKEIQRKVNRRNDLAVFTAQ